MKRLDIQLKELILAALFAALTCVSAFLAIPISVVPFTLQVLIVLTVGALVGKKIGLLSQITYILLGLIGLPVFANGNSGWGYFIGPTGGFIVSFILAVYVVGFLVEKFEKRCKTNMKKFILYILSMLVGLAIIYIIGVYRLSMFIGMEQAIAFGLVPYIGLDLIKVVIAANIVLVLKKPLVKARLLEV
jgi:biotin transport system substrate-specific component